MLSATRVFLDLCRSDKSSTGFCSLFRATGDFLCSGQPLQQYPSQTFIQSINHVRLAEVTLHSEDLTLGLLYAVRHSPFYYVLLGRKREKGGFRAVSFLGRFLETLDILFNARYTCVYIVA